MTDVTLTAATDISKGVKESLAGRFFETRIEPLDFDEAHRNKYFKEGLLERVIYRDLPESFRIGSPDMLK